jgi:polar amino acid transport system substrate-binding protein
MDEAIAAFYSAASTARVLPPGARDAAGAREEGPSLHSRPVVRWRHRPGIRREDDKQFRDFLDKEFDKYYKSGETQKFYEEFLTSRSIDPAKAPPIVKETVGELST